MKAQKEFSSIFQNIDLAFAEIFSQLDQMESRVVGLLDAKHGAEDVPVHKRDVIAQNVSLELACIGLRRGSR
jgi:hypothetical protein